MDNITKDQLNFLSSIPDKKLLNMSSKDICYDVWRSGLCKSEYCKDCIFDFGGLDEKESQYFEIIHQQIKLKKLGF